MDLIMGGYCLCNYETMEQSFEDDIPHSVALLPSSTLPLWLAKRQ